MPVEAGFVAMMAAIASCNVAIRTLTTQVPRPEEVGRFLSLQTSVQQLAAMTGAGLGLLDFIARTLFAAHGDVAGDAEAVADPQPDRGALRQHQPGRS